MRPYLPPSYCGPLERAERLLHEKRYDWPRHSKRRREWRRIEHRHARRFKKIAITQSIEEA